MSVRVLCTVCTCTSKWLTDKRRINFCPGSLIVAITFFFFLHWFHGFQHA